MKHISRFTAVLTVITTCVAFAQAIPASTNDDTQVSGNQPWGVLESYEIPLTCPEHLLRLVDIPSSQTEWLFNQPSIEELKNHLAVKGFSEKEISYILDGCIAIFDPAIGTRLFPDDDHVRNIPLPLRVKTYRLLAENPRNRFHHRPLFMNSENVSGWFRDSGLPRSILADVAQLAYPTPTAKGYYLSDVSFLLRQVHNSYDEQLVLRALMRRPTLIARLKLDATSDLVELSDYWAAGFKNKDILPLMESVVRTKQVDSLDIAHFLPPTPRRNLYSFPELSEGASGRFPDWFWTCYNFFRFTPVDIYADSPNRKAIMTREFELALPPYQFGDVLVIRNGDRAIHGCIYIADNIVYTKNSADIYSPWILMKLNDVVAYHDMSGDTEITAHRKRVLPIP